MRKGIVVNASSLDRTRLAAVAADRCGTTAHDHKRNGTTTLFAVLNVLEGGVISRGMRCHRHQEFIRFLNAVEGSFAKLTRQRLQRGVFHSLVALQAAINRFLAKADAYQRPFCWTKDPDKIIAAVRWGHQALDSCRYLFKCYQSKASLRRGERGLVVFRSRLVVDEDRGRGKMLADAPDQAPGAVRAIGGRETEGNFRGVGQPISSFAWSRR